MGPWASNIKLSQFIHCVTFVVVNVVLSQVLFRYSSVFLRKHYYARVGIADDNIRVFDSHVIFGISRDTNAVVTSKRHNRVCHLVFIAGSAIVIPPRNQVFVTHLEMGYWAVMYRMRLDHFL